MKSSHWWPTPVRVSDWLEWWRNTLVTYQNKYLLQNFNSAICLCQILFPIVIHSQLFITICHIYWNRYSVAAFPSHCLISYQRGIFSNYNNEIISWKVLSWRLFQKNSIQIYIKLLNTPSWVHRLMRKMFIWTMSASRGWLCLSLLSKHSPKPLCVPPLRDTGAVHLKNHLYQSWA